jgi:hypothetical protein
MAAGSPGEAATAVPWDAQRREAERGRKECTVIERRISARRTSPDRRNAERRSITVQRRVGFLRTDPNAGRERRTALRRRDYRRSLFNRRAPIQATLP